MKKNFTLHQSGPCSICKGSTDSQIFDYCRACGFTTMRFQAKDMLYIELSTVTGDKVERIPLEALIDHAQDNPIFNREEFRRLVSEARKEHEQMAGKIDELQKRLNIAGHYGQKEITNLASELEILRKVEQGK